MNMEKQFGLFNNNLENYEPELKEAFLKSLNNYDKEKEKNPDEEIGEWFLVEIISELVNKGVISSEDIKNDVGRTYSELKNNVEQMLSTCGIKHSFYGKNVSTLDISSGDK